VHRATPGQIDGEVAGLRRHRNACVRVVQADRVCGHAAFRQCRGELTSYRGLFSGHALDGEEAHEAVSGGLRVDTHNESHDVAEPVSILRGALLRKAPQGVLLNLKPRAGQNSSGLPIRLAVVLGVGGSFCWCERDREGPGATTTALSSCGSRNKRRPAGLAELEPATRPL
jgi:hypothetical protein